ncbi:TIGR03790 family protein [Luteolibacter pohnpeiensis]|uniref:TIGR03790 family protein n=1 Tax=Luteolibacter pohnpeiensis TaxID=454153 RepID=A0A934VWF4_9BACT|nr:TIGR03790 family protein [Luteolibacter pohnpeiensis]MBK1883220.1 TIGR03790 family protein [Luteolibacter pohnpeiensis]
MSKLACAAEAGMLPGMFKRVVVFWALLVGAGWSAGLPLSPKEVVVVYNANQPDSKKLAEVYRDARNIPQDHLIGLELSAEQDISYDEYQKTLVAPLRKTFDDRAWWKRSKNPEGLIIPVQNEIRVVVLMRGVPLRIKPSPLPEGVKVDPKDPIGGRTESAVDSELAIFGIDGLPVQGALKNQYFQSKKSIREANLPFLMLTARIDAASESTCERMIQDAVEAEKTGLWGRAYIDIANKFPQGDNWLEAIAKKNLEIGIPTVVDRFNDTLPLNYPMTDASIYYGWYDWNVSGPFLNGKFYFKKGAVAIHLHSFSAEQLRNPSKNWSAGLLERGAAVTVGNVYEPYLHLTHWFDVLHDRLLDGNSWVEACWMAMPVTSWQGVVLGDPLYRPFLHLNGDGKMLAEDKDYLLLRSAAMRWGNDPEEFNKQLGMAAERLKSGTVSEALGLDLLAAGKDTQAAVWFRNAKEHFEKAEDKLRQDLHLIAIDRKAGRKAAAVQEIREAQARYGPMPEAKALAGWLDILEPPAPPKALPK